jgi:hypothetical protein
MSDDTAMNYDRLRTVATKIEELIREFQEVPGFWFHEERLRQCVDDLRNYEKIDQWLKSRKELGKLIDPVRAEVFCQKGWVLDVYGIYPPPHEDNYGAKNWFARNPGSDDWIYFGDLPQETVQALRARIHAGEFDDDKDRLFDD